MLELKHSIVLAVSDMKNNIQPVKGARDFYPEEMAIRNWLYQKIRSVAESFGYQEYDGPFLEKIDLYAAKSGEELVKEQAFVFPDRGGDLITLRPELTPSLARMIAARQNELNFPVRWWSFGPFWRYERPQKGRTREFFQWNIDLIGADSPESDAEIACIGCSFFQAVGLKPDEVNILVNNRKLMDSEIVALGIPADQKKEVFKLIDRRDKTKPEAWDSMVIEAGLTESQLDGLKQLLLNRDLWKKSEQLVRFFNAVEALGFSDYVKYDPQIIRGLDYYTGTVFEARDRDGEFRAVLGGGRYENLVADVGGNPLAGVGFAMGDVVVSLVLQKFGLLPKHQASPAKVLAAVFNSETQTSTLKMVAQLRKAGIAAAIYPDAVKLPRQFKYADRAGIRFVLVVGPDEEAQNKVTVKDLSTQTQETVGASELVPYLRSKLAKDESLC
jgi:histidyl-tRNA synthetase